jgi:TonB-like protein
VKQELIVVACCGFQLFLPAFAQTKNAWPCADEVAKTGPYPHVVKVGPPISNEGLIERKVLPDISDFKGRKLNSRIVVDVILDQEGRVVCARAKGNDGALASRSLDAARQWKFRPYLLNDKPIPIQTQIVFVFENEKIASQ